MVRKWLQSGGVEWRKRSGRPCLVFLPGLQELSILIFRIIRSPPENIMFMYIIGIRHRIYARPNSESRVIHFYVKGFFCWQQVVISVQLKFADMPDDVDVVQFPVWNKGRSKWYSLDYSSAEIERVWSGWVFRINKLELFIRGIYLCKSDKWVLVFLGKTTFKVIEPKVQMWRFKI